MAEKVKEDDVVGLKREIGLLGSISFILANIIGSGIFISPKSILEGGGSVGLSLILWIVCGFLALAGSLCLAEMGAMFPLSGGPYNVQRLVLGRLVGFLYMWTSILLITPLSIGLLGMTCAYYLINPFFPGVCGEAPVLLVKLTALAVIALLTAVNMYSVKFTNVINILLTNTKFIVLLLIGLGGIMRMVSGHTEHLEPSGLFANTNTNVGQLATAIYAGIWAYSGWDSIFYIAGEVSRPEKTLTRAVVVSVVSVTGLYLLTNCAYFTAMSPQEILASDAVATGWAERTVPKLVWIVPICVALSTLGTNNAHIAMSSRITYALARDGMWTNMMKMVHVRQATPLPAVVFTGVTSVLVLFPGNLDSLVSASGFCISICSLIHPIAFFVLRIKHPELERPYKAWLGWPVLYMVFTSVLFVASLVQDIRMEYLYSLVIIVLGVLAYVPLVHYNISFPGSDKLTVFVQLLTEVSPTEKDN